MSFKRLEVHTGEDYTVCMFPEQSTEDASIRVFGEDADKVADRLVECWNACSGIKDPVKSLHAIREAIRYVRCEYNGMRELAEDPFSGGEDPDLPSAMEALAAASKLLGSQK